MVDFRKAFKRLADSLLAVVTTKHRIKGLDAAIAQIDEQHREIIRSLDLNLKLDEETVSLILLLGVIKGRSDVVDRAELRRIAAILLMSQMGSPVYYRWRPLSWGLDQLPVVMPGGNLMDEMTLSRLDHRLIIVCAFYDMPELCGVR